MSSLIDSGMVQLINQKGSALDLGDRMTVLAEYSLPTDKNAENVIISGCLVMFMFPGILRTFAGFLERAGVPFTFLSKEYCCGNYLYRPAVKARDEQALEECRQYSREFIGRNIARAKELGAKRIIIFCSPCYPIYKLLYPEEKIIFYPEAIYESIPDISAEMNIDYYPGCYKLHRRMSPVPMDLKSTEQVFKKIKGLQVNRILSKDCCYKPEGIGRLINDNKTDCQVHVCTGCYDQAVKNMPGDKDIKVLMLPELVERIVAHAEGGKAPYWILR